MRWFEQPVSYLVMMILTVCMTSYIFLFLVQRPLQLHDWAIWGTTVIILVGQAGYTIQYYKSSETVYDWRIARIVVVFTLVILFTFNGNLYSQTDVTDSVVFSVLRIVVTAMLALAVFSRFRSMDD